MKPIVLEVDKDDWHRAALDQIEMLALSRPCFTAEDLRPLLNEPHHPGAYGAAFLDAARRNLIVRFAGDRPSRVKSRNGGSVKTWQAHPSIRKAAA